MYKVYKDRYFKHNLHIIEERFSWDTKENWQVSQSPIVT